METVYGMNLKWEKGWFLRHKYLLYSMTVRSFTTIKFPFRGQGYEY